MMDEKRWVGEGGDFMPLLRKNGIFMGLQTV